MSIITPANVPVLTPGIASTAGNRVGPPLDEPLKVTVFPQQQYVPVREFISPIVAPETKKITDAEAEIARLKDYLIASGICTSCGLWNKSCECPPGTCGCVTCNAAPPAPHMRVVLEIVEHARQRYATCGDWQFVDGELRIKVSRLPQMSFEYLVAIHELIEAVLCAAAGVKESDVDRFDMQFKGDGEPGDDPSAPYYRQHQIATEVEKYLAAELGVDWGEYERAIDAL